MLVKKITTQNYLSIAFKIRTQVFVEEQGVPLKDEFDRWDTLDGECTHILAYFNKQPAGTRRIIMQNDEGKLDRICILKSHRQNGIGKLIVESLEKIAKEKGVSKVKLHGQTHAEEFYQKLGYHTSSEAFIEDGILHVLMVKELSSKS